MKYSQNNKNHILLNKIQLLTYVALGISIFYLNSFSHMNYLLRSYLVFLEVGIGFAFIYFLFRKINTNKKKS